MVTDAGVPARDATATVTVLVGDLNDNNPVQVGTYTTSIDEDILEGTQIFAISATDDDLGENSDLRYSIVSGDQNGHLEVNYYNGKMYTASSLDRESIDSYEVIVTVSDRGTPARETNITTTITILDINDNTPQFAQNYHFYILENVANGTLAGTVSATDADINENAVLQYDITDTLSGTDKHFAIEPASGDIYANVDGLDRETLDLYILSVRVADDGVPSLSSTVHVTITITDHNDWHPGCDHETYQADVDENADPGVSVLQITAYDQDINQNSDILFNISGTLAEEYLSIDATSGLITLTKTIDREEIEKITFQVLVTDRGSSPLQGDCFVTVVVNDLNDNIPLFNESFYSLEAADDSTVDDVIFRISANDPDSGINGAVSYAVRESRSYFTVDPSTGKIVNMTCSTDVSLMLDQRRRRWYSTVCWYVI